MSAMDSTADNLKRPLDARPLSPAIFAHFVVRTSNYDAMRRWYERSQSAGRTLTPA